MHKYANYMHKYEKNMQYILFQRNMQKYSKICKLYACYMQKHAKYAIMIFICKICTTIHSQALHEPLATAVCGQRKPSAAEAVDPRTLDQCPLVTAARAGAGPGQARDR